MKNRLIRRLLVPLVLLPFLVACACAQSTGQRYLDEVFSTHQFQSNIQYGVTTTLVLDVYSPPQSDGDTLRPLVMYIHGGGFKDQTKVGSYQTRVCTTLARKGYVVTSINYRLTSSIPNDTVHFEAMVRALQDAKAAVRFFRRNAREFGIDTSQIFVTGSSAGSITALHMAYLDSIEVPSYVRWANVGSSFEGVSGNPGYSSQVHGVVNCWGAIGDTSWLKRGDAPVFCVHGTADKTVFYDSIPADGPFLYGSKFIDERARNLGLRSGLRAFLNTGHTLDNSGAKQDSAIKDFSAWLFTLLKRGRGTTGMKQGTVIAPRAPFLHQNYPNPFNPTTTIEYDLASPGNVSVVVYDVLGRNVSTLVAERKGPGRHRVSFNAGEMTSGIYLVRLSLGAVALSRKMILER